METAGGGNLSFEAYIKDKDFNQSVSGMENKLKGLAETSTKETSKIDDAFRDLSLAVAAYFSVDFATGFMKNVVKVRGEFQQLEIAFETMLKNKQKSDELLNQVTMFAAKTPFDLQQVATGAKQLLAYGEASEEVISTMRKLGDIAAGLSIPFGDLVYLYGTSRTQGKLMTKDLMQFAGRGIPIMDELSKLLNVSKARVMEMAQEGVIGFDELTQVIDNLTNSTGMFGGMMDKQSASLPGLISNLGDAWDQMLNAIGKGQQDTYAEAIKTATLLVENYETVLDVIKLIIASYGAYKAAVVLQAIVTQGYAKALNLVIIKEKLLALLHKANPFAITITAITALIGAFYLYRKSLDDTKKKMDEFMETTNEAVGEGNQLFDQLKKTTVGSDERRAVIAKLVNVYGDYITKLKLEKATLEQIESVQKSSNNELIKKMALDAKNADMKEWFVKELEIRKAVADAGLDFDAVYEERKVKRNDQGVLQFTSYGQEIDNLFMNYEVVQQEKKKVEELYDKVISSIKTTFTIKDEDDEDPTPEIKTFAQKLEAVKKLYSDYYTWVEAYGEESANKQFSNLLKGGQNYLSYINKEIGKLENLKKRTKAQDDNLVTLLSEKNEITGIKTRVEQIRDEIEEARTGYDDLADYIDYLSAKLSEAQLQDDGGEQSLAIITTLREELKKSQKEYVQESLKTYKELIEQTADFAKQRLMVEEQFQKDVKALDRASLGEEKYNQGVEAAKAKKAKSLAEITEEEVKQSNAYKQITNSIEELTGKQVKLYISQLEQQLTLLDKESDLYKEIVRQIKSAQKSLKETTAEGFMEAANILGQMAQNVKLFNEGLGESIGFAGELVGAVGQIASGNVIGGALQGVSAIFNYMSSASERREQETEERRQRELEATAKLIDILNKSVERQITLLNELVGNEKLSQYARTFIEIGKSMSEVIKEMEALDELVMKTVDGRTYNISLKDRFTSADFNLTGITDAYDRVVAIREAIASIDDTMAYLTSQIDSEKIKGNDAEQLQQLLSTYQEYVEKLKEVQNRYFEEITGSSYEGIVDGVLSAFEQGLTGAENFADNFESLMRKAMLQALSINALQAPLQGWYEMFANMAQSENELTAEEIELLRKKYDMIISNAEEYAQHLEEVTGISFEDEETAKALSGAVKGVTEETASVIAGQMNAIRIAQSQTISILKSDVMANEETARNTRYIKQVYDLLTLGGNELGGTGFKL